MRMCEFTEISSDVALGDGFEYRVIVCSSEEKAKQTI